MENKTEIFTVCPNNQDYIEQMKFLNYCFLLKGSELPTTLIPDYSELDNSRIINKLIRVDIGKKKVDKYYEKFSLLHIKVLNKKTQFLYLDADHILINDFNFNNLAKNIIWVSSELREFSELLSDNEITSINQIYSSIKSNIFCYNTSLIFGNSDYFIGLLDEWKKVYIQLYGLINHRHLEEISFSIAAYNLKIQVNPLPNNIQSNFHSINSNTQLFHYGGESEKSNYVKSIINSSSMTQIEKYKTIIDYICHC